MKNYLAAIVLLLISSNYRAQDVTISGTIKDASNGEDLIGAAVLVKELPNVGALTNVYGFYSLTIPKGKYTVIYRYTGFSNQEFVLNLEKDTTINIELSDSDEVLGPLVIQGESENENISSTETSLIKLNPKDIEAVPVLFGEKDVLKTIALMPGVQSQGEGQAGFNVRGGSADQNLILLDGAPVYNASHLLGFFSVFNSDALKDVALYKGGIPAEYGGRISSVMDIVMKEGNTKRFGVSGGLGLISSRLTIESPIVKDKGSFILSGRRTYADIFTRLSSDEFIQNARLYFYDMNAKANYQIGEKDRVFVSGYFGRDRFGVDGFGFDWGNITTTARWNHIFNNKLFANTSFIYSDYDYDIEIGEDDEAFSFGSRIIDFNLKHDYQWYASDKHSLKFGVNAIYHTVKPGDVEASNADFISASNIEDRYGLESAVYIGDDIKINKRLNMMIGIRLSSFIALGEGNIYSYDAGGDVTDTTYYGKNESYANYIMPEPRAAVTYLLNETSSFKASYNRNAQYLHLLSNSTTSTPTDIWMLSSNNIKPQSSDQIALGYYKNFDKGYEISTEVYYKQMYNVIDYKTGADVNFNATVEGDLVYGDGRAYGIEMYAKKKKGPLTGWVSYTLSRTERQFDEINQNSWFPARQDRTHDVSIVALYKLNDRITFSANWIYYTGNAVTFPSGKYMLEGNLVNYYTERNGYRFPDYHRGDIGMTLYNKKTKTAKDPETGEDIEVERRWESNWNFSVYNVYGRENAYTISFRESETNPGTTEAVQLALFKQVPSITYNFKF